MDSWRRRTEGDPRTISFNASPSSNSTRRSTSTAPSNRFRSDRNTLRRGPSTDSRSTRSDGATTPKRIGRTVRSAASSSRTRAWVRSRARVVSTAPGGAALTNAAMTRPLSSRTSSTSARPLGPPPLRFAVPTLGAAIAMVIPSLSSVGVLRPVDDLLGGLADRAHQAAALVVAGLLVVVAGTHVLVVLAARPRAAVELAPALAFLLGAPAPPGFVRGVARSVLAPLAAHHLGQRRVVADGGEIQPVHGLREPQVGIDARHHDAGVHREELDPHERDAHERVDDEALVEQDVEHVGQAARPAAALGRRRGWCHHRHGPHPSRSSCCAASRSAHSIRDTSPASPSRSCRLGYFVILSNRMSAYFAA